MIDLWLAIVIAALVALAFAVLMRRRLPFAAWSPVYGVPAVYVSLGLAGFLYYRANSDIGGFYDLGLSQSELATGFAAFLIAAAACLAGSLFYIMTSERLRRFSASPLRRAALRHRPVARRPVRSPRLSSLVTLGLPLLLVVIGKGASNILWRPEYLVERYHYVLIVGDLLAIPAIVALGVMIMTARRLRWRVVLGTLFVVYWLLFLSLSTRLAAVIFMFLLLGLAIGGAGRLTLGILTMLWVAALPVLLAVPIALRAMPEQGLESLPRNLATISKATSVADYSESLGSLIKNVAFGVPLAAYVSAAPQIPSGVFATSLSPLPSFVPVPGLPSWNDVQDQLRVNRYIPYSAVGELLNQGWLWIVLYFVVVGAVCGWGELGARRFERRRPQVGYLIACGLLFLFAITSTEYNLRSSTRLLYYAVAIAALWRLVSRLRIRVPTRRLSGGDSLFGTRHSYPRVG